MNSEAMQDFFKKIPVQIPKPPSHSKKRQLLLNDVGGNWYMKNLARRFQP